MLSIIISGREVQVTVHFVYIKRLTLALNSISIWIYLRSDKNVIDMKYMYHNFGLNDGRFIMRERFCDSGQAKVPTDEKQRNFLKSCLICIIQQNYYTRCHTIRTIYMYLSWSKYSIGYNYVLCGHIAVFKHYLSGRIFLNFSFRDFRKAIFYLKS